MKNFITYKQPKTVRITDVNDSMHCYAEFDIVNLVAEFIEDDQKFFVAEKSSSDFQQQITAKEFTTEIDLKQYIGKTGEICDIDKSVEPCLLHFVPAGGDVKILSLERGFKARVKHDDIIQTIDIRDLNF